MLNETYNRTAFPSTEERIELAKKLGMSARSVQIWYVVRSALYPEAPLHYNFINTHSPGDHRFQNKRQAMRQSSRQAASAVPPVAAEPFTAGPAPGAGSSVAAPAPQALQGGAYGGMGGMGALGMAQGYAGPRIDAYGRSGMASPPTSSQYRARSYDEHERRSPSRSR